MCLRLSGLLWGMLTLTLRVNGFPRLYGGVVTGYLARALSKGSSEKEF